jgi:7,8-dihydropterin-6-yl-methyl-4-(beta-D-ribofuranosyl)aminobenzene 5'-phosphate synthase
MKNTITILYDNTSTRDDLDAAWGFSALVSHPEGPVLFDTGGDGTRLLNNMRQLDIAPASIKHVVLSHIDWDHTGGLWLFLQHAPRVTVWGPAAFPAEFIEEVQQSGAHFNPVDEPCDILPGLQSTGQLFGVKDEQGLVVNGTQSSLLITGCAHPGIASMVQRAHDTAFKPLKMVIGGFHLASHPVADIEQIIQTFQSLEITHVAPSHCTGEQADSMFKTAYGDRCLPLGVGRTLSLLE